MQGTMGGQRLALHSCPAPQRRRPFQCVARKQLTPKESRIGKVPIVLPAGVSVKIDGQHITVKARPTLPWPVISGPDALDARWLTYTAFTCLASRQRACHPPGTPRRARAFGGHPAGHPASGGRLRAAQQARREQESQRAARPLEVGWLLHSWPQTAHPSCRAGLVQTLLTYLESFTAYVPAYTATERPQQEEAPVAGRGLCRIGCMS